MAYEIYGFLEEYADEIKKFIGYIPHTFDCFFIVYIPMKNALLFPATSPLFKDGNLIKKKRKGIQKDLSRSSSP